MANQVTLSTVADIQQALRPAYPSVGTVLRHHMFATCLVLTFTIYICLTTLTYCCANGLQSNDVTEQHVTRANLHPARRHLTSQNDDNSAAIPSRSDSSEMTSSSSSRMCRRLYVYTIGAFVTVVYLVYLVDCWQWRVVGPRDSRVDYSTVNSMLESLRHSKPLVWWSAVSYHYMPRHSHVTRLRHGRMYSTSHVYWQRVVTSRAASGFDHTSTGVRDATPWLTDIERFPVVRVTFSRQFSFATDSARREFVEQRDEFCQAYRSCDDYFDFRQGLSLLPSTHFGTGLDGNNFRSSVLALRDLDADPWWLTQSAYWIASLLTLSWPMRLFVRLKIATVEVGVRKVFGDSGSRCSVPPESSIRVSRLMSAGTMSINDPPTADDEIRLVDDDSTSRSTSISGGEGDDVIGKSSAATSGRRYVLVPSYSQALLMDCWPSAKSRAHNHDNKVKRVQSCVAFNVSCLRSTSGSNPVESPPVRKSHSFSNRRLFPIEVRPEELFPPMTSSLPRDRRGRRSPPPSYDSALAMQLAPLPKQQQHRRGRNQVDSCVFIADSRAAAALHVQSTCSNVAIMETCL